MIDYPPIKRKISKKNSFSEKIMCGYFQTYNILSQIVEDVRARR